MGAPLNDQEAKSGQDLLIAMGNVLATWQGVEHAVLHLYLTFYRPHRLDSANITYHAVRTFDARLVLVDALIRHFCTKDVREHWAKVFQAIRRKGQRRNAVAHGLVVLWGTPPKREYRIGTSPFDMQRAPKPEEKQETYSISELRGICDVFSNLSQRILAFSTDVSIDLNLQPGFVEPQAATTKIEARYPLLVPMPQEPEHPPQPSDLSPQSDD